ncbi:hypothetical protein LJC20_02875 [Eubacteriales bacterium OttesenSCG-928-M02]|nr:hypothetical protein [Eubacteriales bacterium OttesenSCG-928-M02]
MLLYGIIEIVGGNPNENHLRGYYIMFIDKIKRIISLYEEKKIKVGPGLSNAQIQQAEDFYDIVFPPDIRQLIQAIKPEKGSAMNFPDWDDFSQKNIDTIQDQLNWPINGALFDVEHNNFWLKSWGERPAALEEQLIIADKQMRLVPKLIPITGHRYISSNPNECGNPVYSVYQMDIIFMEKISGITLNLNSRKECTHN